MIFIICNGLAAWMALKPKPSASQILLPELRGLAQSVAFPPLRVQANVYRS